MFIGGRFEGKELLPYIFAQVIGAILAAAVLYFVATGKAEFDIAASGLASNGYGEHSPGGYSIAAALTIEIVLTAFFLIIIMVWLQTGYAMVILSSAIKGVPAELLEAARMDGATEIKAFFSVVVPYIKGTLLTVTTTIVIFSLKTFDIVRVMTGGNNGTNVIANEFYLQSFTYTDAGKASAIAIVLLLLVTPVIFNNVRQYTKSRRGF